MALRPAVFDRYILSFDVAGFAQSLEERGNKWCRRRAGRPGVEDADHRHRLLLRAAGKRQRDCRTHEKGKRLASLHQKHLKRTSLAGSSISHRTAAPSFMGAHPSFTSN